MRRLWNRVAWWVEVNPWVVYLPGIVGVTLAVLILVAAVLVR